MSRVLRVAERSKLLTVFNVNKCARVTYESLVVLARKNPHLSTLHASCTMISDRGLTLLAAALIPSGGGSSSSSSSAAAFNSSMTSVDLSFCGEVSDSGVTSLAEACPKLRFLSLCGLSRVTDRGVQAICHSCLI